MTAPPIVFAKFNILFASGFALSGTTLSTKALPAFTMDSTDGFAIASYMEGASAFPTSMAFPTPC